VIRLDVQADAEAACRRAAELVAEAAAARAPASWAISGGEGPGPMFRALGELDLPWDAIGTWQVDERVAPPGDPARNRTLQERELPPAALAGIRWMPVEDGDLEAGAARYGATVPDRLDVVHLGLGPDGHTASLVPDDPVLDIGDRTVSVTDAYRGHRRMTLTYPGLARADRAVWLVTGEDKRDALGRLLAGDRAIPAGRVDIADQVVVADVAASGDAG
jgi:6-phosphogluconolactonase